MIKLKDIGMTQMSIKREVIKKIDHKLVEEIVEDELLERFKSCFQCGTCSGGCPSGRRTAMRTRDLIRQALAGLEDELLTSDLLWLCSTCYTCAERCPRNVPSTDIILKLRNLAAHKGLMRGPHIAVSKNLIATGHGVPIDNERWSNFRKSLKLSPLPPTVHSFPEALKEVQTIVKETGFEEMIAYGESIQKEMIKKDQEMAPQKIKALEDQLAKLKESQAPAKPAAQPQKPATAEAKPAKAAPKAAAAEAKPVKAAPKPAEIKTEKTQEKPAPSAQKSGKESSKKSGKDDGKKSKKEGGRK